MSELLIGELNLIASKFIPVSTPGSKFQMKCSRISVLFADVQTIRP